MQVFREPAFRGGSILCVAGDRVPLSIVLSKWSVFLGWKDKQVGVQTCKYYATLWRPYKHGHKAHNFEWWWLVHPSLFVHHIQHKREMRRRDRAAQLELEAWLREQDQSGRNSLGS